MFSQPNQPSKSYYLLFPLAVSSQGSSPAPIPYANLNLSCPNFFPVPSRSPSHFYLDFSVFHHCFNAHSVSSPSWKVGATQHLCPYPAPLAAFLSLCVNLVFYNFPPFPVFFALNLLNTHFFQAPLTFPQSSPPPSSAVPQAPHRPPLPPPVPSGRHRTPSPCTQL